MEQEEMEINESMKGVAWSTDWYKRPTPQGDNMMPKKGKGYKLQAQTARPFNLFPGK